MSQIEKVHTLEKDVVNEVVASDNEKSAHDALELTVDVKKMTRKIDTFLLPLLFLTYTIQFMDKLALSASSVFGIKTDNDLVGQDYSWVSAIFYFGYLACQPLAARFIQIAPAGKTLSISVFLWGIILASSAATHSYAGQLCVRFFLGCTEAFVSPICLQYSAVFYTKKQQPSRVGIWFAGNDFGGILSGFIAFGLGHITNHLSPWKYIAIVYGCMSIVWSFVLFFLLPDSPQTCRFLSEDEKAYYKEYRSQSTVAHIWNWPQFWETILDIKTWLFLFLVVLNILPNGGIISFGFIIIEGFGFTNIETTIMNVPISVITWLAIVGSGFAASKLPNARCYVIAATVVLPAIGAGMVYGSTTKGVQFTGYLFMCIQPATFPNVLALATSNFKSTQKRVTIAGLIFIFYCGMNVAAPQLFLYTEAPRYPTAFKTWIICFCLTFLLAFITRFYLVNENKKKAAKVAAGEDTPEGDCTDLEDPRFMYNY